MRIISIVNQKGGCGKTTTAINLSACLAANGRKVLLIDMDPQGHSTIGLNIKTEALDKTIYEVLCGFEDQKIKIDDASFQTAEVFRVVPSNIKLSTFEQQLSKVPGRETKLKESIEGLTHHYDYILIDCPPSLGLLTFNSLMASSEVFIPIDMGFFSLHGTGKLMEIIELVRNKTGHEIRVKALATMYDRRTRIAREILENVRNHFKRSMFETVINFNVRLKEAAGFGKTIVDFDSKSQGYKDYLELAGEVLEEDGQFKKVSLAASPKASLGHQNVACKFILHAPEAASVRIVGSFNNWIPTGDYLMERNPDGTWSKIIPLSPGEYQYKFIVDDKWVEDLNNPNVVTDPYGGRNSILSVN